jgi:hypothetical protein
MIEYSRILGTRSIQTGILMVSSTLSPTLRTIYRHNLLHLLPLKRIPRGSSSGPRQTVHNPAITFTPVGIRIWQKETPNSRAC